MKLTFHIVKSERIKGLTGDNGYSYQKVNAPTSVVSGDTLTFTFSPNAYIKAPIWRLMTEDGRVLPWAPVEGDLSAAEIIDAHARELASTRR